MAQIDLEEVVTLDEIEEVVTPSDGTYYCC